MYDYIQSNPGATLREVLRGADVQCGSGRHHMGMLKRENRIIERAHKSTLRYFDNDDAYADGWESLVMLREPDLNIIYEWLLAHPGAAQKDILAWANRVMNWSRSTLQNRLARLVDANVVVIRSRGRYKCYEPVACKPAGVPTAHAPASWHRLAAGPGQ